MCGQKAQPKHWALWQLLSAPMFLLVVLELIFEIVRHKGLISLCGYPFFLDSLIKETVLLSVCVQVPLSKIIWLWMHTLTSRLCVLFHWFMFLSSCCFDYCNFVIYLKSGSAMPSVLFFLLKIILKFFCGYIWILGFIFLIFWRISLVFY